MVKSVPTMDMFCDELLLRIFGFMPHDDRINLGQTSKRMHAIAWDESLWRELEVSTEIWWCAMWRVRPGVVRHLSLAGDSALDFAFLMNHGHNLVSLDVSSASCQNIWGRVELENLRSLRVCMEITDEPSLKTITEAFGSWLRVAKTSRVEHFEFTFADYPAGFRFDLWFGFRRAGAWGSHNKHLKTILISQDSPGDHVYAEEDFWTNVAEYFPNVECVQVPNERHARAFMPKAAVPDFSGPTSNNLAITGVSDATTTSTTTTSLAALRGSAKTLRFPSYSSMVFATIASHADSLVSLEVSLVDCRVGNGLFDLPEMPRLRKLRLNIFEDDNFLRHVLPRFVAPATALERLEIVATGVDIGGVSYDGDFGSWFDVVSKVPAVFQSFVFMTTDLVKYPMYLMADTLHTFEDWLYFVDEVVFTSPYSADWFGEHLPLARRIFLSVQLANEFLDMRPLENIEDLVIIVDWRNEADSEYSYDKTGGDVSPAVLLLAAQRWECLERVAVVVVEKTGIRNGGKVASYRLCDGDGGWKTRPFDPINYFADETTPWLAATDDEMHHFIHDKRMTCKECGDDRLWCSTVTREPGAETCDEFNENY
ncbi:hypothetical protein DFJ74DRAFT_703969 [Hyaloraphidium curvatum]|nr:hypothetical protein DFJ74DRAFT_703969 [Hyaloraphidium curvatum]